jgi:hypothetical protein
LQVVSHADPQTYEVDALRALMVSQATSSYSVSLDVGILFGITSLLAIIAGICTRRSAPELSFVLDVACNPAGEPTGAHA